ncbi:MAG: hypothetical protein MK165_14145 [Pirellulaceae bacterium]|nr:hypothetical protein [Pirellulaceae bacterium]
MAASITQLEHRLERANRLASKKAMQALRLFRARPDQAKVWHSNAKERQVGGGNRSSKSTVCAIEFASVAQQIPVRDVDENLLPMKCQGRRQPLVMWSIGLGESHISNTIFPKLFLPGAFKIIRDLKTNKWRTWRGYDDPEDKDREADSRPAPPLIPADNIARWGWNKKTVNLPDRVELTSGTTIVFFTSKGDVQQGTDCDWIWIDEDIERAEHYMEYIARLVDRKGFLTWSSWPKIANPALLKLHERAKDQELEVAKGERKTADAEYFNFRFSSNNFLDPEEKRKTLEAWGSEGEEVLRARDRGEFVTESVLMYPNFSPEIHGIDFHKDADDMTPLARSIHFAGRKIPADWTRYMTLDPGHNTTAILFFAVPPPSEFESDFVVLYDELYLKQHDAKGTAKQIAVKSRGYTIERAIVDRRMARQTATGIGRTFKMIYDAALKDERIVFNTNGSQLMLGSDNVDAGILAVRDWLAVRDDGTCKLQVMLDRVPNWVSEIKAYRKHILKDSVEDRPASGQKDHAMDAMRYGALGDFTYVPPPQQVPEGTSPIVDQFHRIMRPAKKEAADQSWNMGPVQSLV